MDDKVALSIGPYPDGNLTKLCGRIKQDDR